MSGVAVDRLPPLVPGGSVVGTVLPEVAAAIGIPAEARVVTGAPDLQNAVVASGCIDLHQAHMSLGTSAWVSCPVPRKKTDIVRQMASVPGIGNGTYVLANNQDNAGRCLEWFRNGFAPETSYDELEALAEAAEPGAGGVIFTPWLTGERSPIDDRRARGGFHNVSLEADRGQLTRAVLEGVAMNMRWLLSGVERFVGERLDPIRLLGGGAQMDVWCQIMADVCDRSFERVADPLVGGLRGAGLFVGMAIGEVDAADVHGLVPVDRVFTPDPARRAVYDRLFAEFPKLYSRNKGMFARLNR
jgi:xylulokinase